MNAIALLKKKAVPFCCGTASEKDSRLEVAGEVQRTVSRAFPQKIRWEDPMGADHGVVVVELVELDFPVLLSVVVVVVVVVFCEVVPLLPDDFLSPSSLSSSVEMR
jgi:hypothetical protein